MTSKRILVVDGGPKNVLLLQEVLSNGGFTTLTASKGAQAVSLTAVEQPSLMILDVVLPGETDGFEVISRVREFSELPIIILSALTDPEDILRGFALGADDFVTKPYDPRILLARIRAVLKRSTQQTIAPSEIRCNHLVIDLATRSVTSDGAEVYLTETEYKLLLELARNSNRVLMHDYLLKAVWGAAYCTEVNYLRSYIHMLRHKLERDPSQPKIIISRPGIGYMFVSRRNETAGENDGKQ